MREYDIPEVMAEEIGRGRRRPSEAAARKFRQTRLAGLRKLLVLGTKAEFIAAIRAYGVKIHSPEFQVALRAWREYRRP